MSLAAILNPPPPGSTSTSSIPATTTLPSSTSIPFTHQPAYITLHRMLIRYQHILLNQPPSDPPTPLQQQIHTDLHSPLPYHRTKWLHNIEHARTLLLQLEHAAQAIKVQSAKRAAVHDLAEKRVVIKKLRLYVEEIGREVDNMGEEKWEVENANGGGQTLEEILGRPPLSQQTEPNISKRNSKQDDTLREGRPIQSHSSTTTTSSTAPNDLFNSTTRRRTNNPAPGAPADTATASSTSYTPAASTSDTLHNSSLTHETLTSSLLNLTVQLKQQSQAFAATLASSDKDYLSRALDGLDRNVSSMTLASKNMAYLKRLSEGEGWFGRMKLYLMIYGLWIAAILLVFVMPKLRF